MLRSNVIGRKLSQNEIRLMALQNMKSNNGSVLQPHLTKRESHVNSFQPRKRVAPTRPTIQTVVYNNNIRSNVAIPPPANPFINTLVHRQRFVHGQNRSRSSDEISNPLNQNQNSYGDNFQTAAQAAQVRLSGIKPTVRNEEIAMHFGRFGRIVNIKNSVGNENRIIQFASRLEAQRCLSAGSQQKICDSLVSVVPFDSQYSISLKRSRGSTLMKQKLNGSPPKVDNGKVSEALSKSIDGSSSESSMKIENRDPRLEKDEDDFEEDNTEHLPRCKKQKLTNTKVDQATSKRN